jgi:hypothetical protein
MVWELHAGHTRQAPVYRKSGEYGAQTWVNNMSGNRLAYSPTASGEHHTRQARQAGEYGDEIPLEDEQLVIAAYEKRNGGARDVG